MIEVNMPEMASKGKQRGTVHWEDLYDRLLDASRRGKAIGFTPETFEAWAGDKIRKYVLDHIVGDQIDKEAQPRQFVAVLAWPEIKARLDQCAKRRGHYAGRSPLRHCYEQDKRVLNIWIEGRDGMVP